MAYQFTVPGRTIAGEHALEESKGLFPQFGQKALIVTGKHVTKAGILKRLTDVLEEAGVLYTVYNDITGEPTDEMIDAGVALYKKEGCDFCIGIGGGSPLDSAKAINALQALGGGAADYCGREMDGDFAPLALIPTTAGTGSEATKFTVITDTQNHVKMLLKGEKLLPDLAILDPALTVSAPQGITAATGMDALTHAVEAYTSKKSSPLTDTLAISAIKRIFLYLPQVYKDGANLEARTQMAIAAYEAGICINNSSVTVVHGMSRPIGALFHVPHGISNAMLISKCLGYVLDGCYGRFAHIARAIGAAGENTDDVVASELFVESLERLCEVCEIPTLEEYGIDKADFDAVADKMAEDAMASGSPGNTRKEVTKQDLLVIYENLWK